MKPKYVETKCLDPQCGGEAVGLLMEDGAGRSEIAWCEHGHVYTKIDAYDPEQVFDFTEGRR